MSGFVFLCILTYAVHISSEQNTRSYFCLFTDVVLTMSMGAALYTTVEYTFTKALVIFACGIRFLSIPHQINLVKQNNAKRNRK